MKTSPWKYYEDRGCDYRVVDQTLQFRDKDGVEYDVDWDIVEGSDIESRLKEIQKELSAL